MLRAKLAIFAGAVMLAGSSFAYELECPDLAAIQAEGLSMSLAMQSVGFYAAYQISQFDTDKPWLFGILPIAADSDEDALESANELLADMSSPGVVWYENTCKYETNDPNVWAVAMQNDFPLPSSILPKLMLRHV